MALATAVIFVFNCGGGAGLVGGGTGGQLLYNRRKEWMLLMCGAALLCAPAAAYYIINVDLKAAGLGPTMVMAALLGFMGALPAPNLRAVGINVNGARARAQCGAMVVQ